MKIANKTLFLHEYLYENMVAQEMPWKRVRESNPDPVASPGYFLGLAFRAFFSKFVKHGSQPGAAIPRLVQPRPKPRALFIKYLGLNIFI